MSKKDLILSLNEETFSALKKDFDTILNRTIGNMEMRGASDAVITLKLTVSLDKRSMTVGDCVQEFKKPTFKHEINSVMQIKDKMTGQLSGEYAMVWDEEEECFVLRQFDGGQTSMFDDDHETEEEEPLGRFVDMPDDAHSLPAPAEEMEDVPSDPSVKPSEDKTTPFGWLCQFIGERMIVTEAMGNYTVRTENNKVVLSSATSKDSPFWCDAEKLAPHVGHNVICAGYGDEDIVNVSIECEDCGAVLFDLDAPDASDEEVSEATAENAEDVEVDGLEYDDPEEE